MATLRSLTIQNFKAIGDPVKIEFKPITLLFGPNSAGKSTIIQALTYAREIFLNRNLDPHRIVVHGEEIDLGGFRTMVHNHDISLPIYLEIEIELGENRLPEYIADDELRDSIMEYASCYLNCLSEVRWVTVGVSLKWDDRLPGPYVKSYRVNLNGEFFCEITGLTSNLESELREVGDWLQADFEMRPGYHYVCPRLNLKHSLFDSGTGADSRNLLTELAELILEDPWSWHWTGDASERKRNPILAATPTGALPDWDSPHGLSAGLKTDVAFKLIQGFDELLRRAVAGPGKLIRETLRTLRCLGPLRAIPPRILEQGRPVHETAVSSGLSTWEELFGVDEQTLGAINDWMTKPARLETGFEIDVKRYKECDSTLLAACGEAQVGDPNEIMTMLRKMPERTRLSLRQAGSKLELSFQDVGTGISQVMPVVIAALVSRNQVVTIEQPELHIHPALQVRLGDLFISQIKEPGVLFILETHSEHLLLRILRRMRETAEGRVADEKLRVRPDDVAVLYVEPDGPRTIVRQMPLNERGELVKAWPGGFFEEGLREVF